MIKNYNDFLIKENNDNDYYKNVLEYTILKDVNLDALLDLVQKAIDKDVKIISTLPDYVSDVKIFLGKKPITISAVVNFPEGKDKFTDSLKVIEDCVIKGVNELDYTIDYKLFDDTHKKYAERIEKLTEEITKISEILHRNSIIFKLVVDINNLTFSNLKKLSEIANEAGVDFIQTSTGKMTDIKKARYLRSILPDYINIKVAGQIRTINQAKEFKGIADRIGSSTILY